MLGITADGSLISVMTGKITSPAMAMVALAKADVPFSLQESLPELEEQILKKITGGSGVEGAIGKLLPEGVHMQRRFDQESSRAGKRLNEKSTQLDVPSSNKKDPVDQGHVDDFLQEQVRDKLKTLALAEADESRPLWSDQYNRQTDQQASTSSSGLEQGELGQVEDKQQLTKKCFEYLIEHNLQELKDEIFQWLDTSDILRAYRSFDQGYKILSNLDNQKRQSAIQELKISELAEHFNVLKTSDERKNFLEWIGPNKFTDLYRYFRHDTNELRDFLSALEFEQIVKLDQHSVTMNKSDKKGFYRAVPLENLKLLMDKFGAEYPDFSTRQDAEYFNTLKTENERKGFVRELELEQVGNLYKYLEDDPKKQRELCRAIAPEDLEKVYKQLGLVTFKTYWGVYLRAKKISALKTSDERKNFLEGKKTQDVAELYLYFDDKPDRQKELCRSLKLKNLELLMKELNLEESEVARSCLKEWNVGIGG
jgi:hypothetical protein